MGESIFVRGEGGSVFEMDLPLRPDHAARLAAGSMQRVNHDGSTWFPAPDAATPAGNDPDDLDDLDDLDADGAGAPELDAFLSTPVEPSKSPVKGKSTIK